MSHNVRGHSPDTVVQALTTIVRTLLKHQDCFNLHHTNVFSRKKNLNPPVCKTKSQTDIVSD